MLGSLVGRLLGGDADGVALVPSTSYGLAAVAPNLDVNDGDRIVVLAEEYPSGIYMWRRLAAYRNATIVTTDRVDGRTWTEALLEAIVDRAAVISVPQVHWTDGSWLI